MAATPASDRSLERHALDLAQPFRRMLDERQFVVRVGGRVAVARKVFSARGDAFSLQRTDDRRAETGDVFRVVGERAIANDRVLRVGLDVEHRCVVEREADRFELGRERAREPFRQPTVAAPAQRRHRRPLGKRRLQSGHAAAFLVDGDPRRKVRRQARSLEAHLGDLLRLADIAREEDDAAESELPRQRPQLGRNLMAVESGDEQLTDLAPQRRG